MDFNFILDENFLAYQILKREIQDESKDIKKILLSTNRIGYKKILREEALNPIVYISNNSSVRILIDELVSTKKFNEIYELYSDNSKDTIAIKILNGMIEEDDELREIKDNLWFKYMEVYKSIFNIEFSSFSIILLDDDINKIIQDFKETKVFKKMYIETKLYLEDVKDYWVKKKKFVNDFLNRILKIDIVLQPTVYITHPNTYTGYSFDGDKIAWGHYKGINDPDYNLVYLVHECLHCLLPFREDETEDECNIKHSIIELISDYELYSLLKGQSTLKEGHPYLKKYKKFIYPHYLRYIGLNNKQIIQRYKMDSINPNDLTNFEDNDVSNMNIQEFIKFCNENYRLFVDNNSNNPKKDLRS